MNIKQRSASGEKTLYFCEILQQGCGSQLSIPAFFELCDLILHTYEEFKLQKYPIFLLKYKGVCSMVVNSYFDDEDQNAAFIRCANFIKEMLEKYGGLLEKAVEDHKSTDD